MWVNGTQVGSHWGGYLPFSFDITSALHAGQNELIVMVQDETEAAMHQKGKQRLHPGGIWYTSISGIWQTVWLEVLPKKHIRSLKITPVIDTNMLEVKVKVSEATLKSICQIEAIASFEGQEVGRVRSGPEKHAGLSPARRQTLASGSSLTSMTWKYESLKWMNRLTR